MANPNPRAAMPAETGVDQLLGLIHGVAEGRLPVDEFLATFRRVHEAIERQGRVQYHSKDEARLIWDVLWVLEFYSPDPAREANPAEWNDAAGVLAEVRRASQRLKDLQPRL